MRHGSSYVINLRPEPGALPTAIGKAANVQGLPFVLDLRRGGPVTATSEGTGGLMALSPAASGARVFNGFGEIVSFIWSVADLLRGDYKQADYGKVILPFTVLRRLDCVLDRTKAKVLAKYADMKGGPVKNLEPMLNRITGVPFHNTSKFDFEKLKGDPNHIAPNLKAYIRGFSSNAQDVIERFDFEKHVAKLDESNLLFLLAIAEKRGNFDLTSEFEIPV